MSTTLNKLIAEFAKKYGMPDLEQTPEGHFEWYVDANPVRFFESAGKIYVAAQVRKLPDEKRERGECVRTALKAALANADSHRESLYIDVNQDALCLYRCMASKELSLFDFEKLLESFMHALDCMTEITGAIGGYARRDIPVLAPHTRF
ncbi:MULTISPECIES: CesT family type III secretion system chaperone [unclassified Hahella]|uniref:CesT family type III secretion system chaperone n=1 Tax=unclassified Hahella TaxID=2624107 RepID=UPI001C1EE76A|nr:MULTISPECIES: CesT family type III secretion system chaperone [unclassified Hahella]MBU6949829.1 CesT family type III secretion system chaperone [Hahella sp. HN01]MDG9668378.1 CesT family type III secretion system chaperone [Hahella sp. CR1]